MNEAPVAHYPKLVKTDFGFAVTDGVQSFPVEDFAEAKEMAKLAVTDGMDAVAEALFGPYDYVEDEDGSVAYARMLERRAEAGSWWGQDDYDGGY